MKVEPRKSEILKAWEWFYITTRIIETDVVRVLAGVCIMQLMDGGKQCLGVWIKIVSLICIMQLMDGGGGG